MNIIHTALWPKGMHFILSAAKAKTPAAKGRETGLTFILVRVGGIGDKNLAAPQPFSWEPDLGEAETACSQKRCCSRLDIQEPTMAEIAVM